MTDFTVVNLHVYFRPSYKKTDLRSSQARQRLKYESMLKKNSSPGGATDSGFEDERDVDPDNAIELTGNVYKRTYMYKYKQILFFFSIFRRQIRVASGTLCFGLQMTLLPMSFSQDGFIITCTLLLLAHNDSQSHLWYPGLGFEPGSLTSELPK